MCNFIVSYFVTNLWLCTNTGDNYKLSDEYLLKFKARVQKLIVPRHIRKSDDMPPKDKLKPHCPVLDINCLSDSTPGF